ncbi:hypothetical protein EC957_003416 [Mortierella hygrophila]|uniref:Uncharacterized protein n=1 Tax=Mortierella hygrophila TaxID=979708 RepID=A0A9P6F206_9FUNG|nr:hypothetical protein EC957_003416 [Mortierella hygrophila]
MRDAPTSTLVYGHAIRDHLNFYTVNGKQRGEILLTIAVASTGQTEAQHPQSEIRVISKLDSEHQTLITGLSRKERGLLTTLLCILVGAK